MYVGAAPAFRRIHLVHFYLLACHFCTLHIFRCGVLTSRQFFGSKVMFADQLMAFGRYGAVLGGFGLWFTHPYGD